MLKFFVTALTFALIAGYARHHNLHTESRLQILAFWGLALFYEVEVRTISSADPSWISFGLNGSASTIAIIAMKWLIEGLPSWWP